MSTSTLNYRPIGLKLRGEELERYREFVAERDARYAKGEGRGGSGQAGAGAESLGRRRLRMRAAALAQAFPPGSKLTYDQIRDHVEATGWARSGAAPLVSELRRLGLFPYQIEAKKAGRKNRRDLAFAKTR